MSEEIYWDDCLAYSWEKDELLDQVSAHDEEWKIKCDKTFGRTCYSLEATGLYSVGDLVEVRDIEITGGE